MIKGGSMFAPQRILVPTDFSTYSENALKHAMDIAKQNKSRIILLHVLDDGFTQCTAEYCIDDETYKTTLNKIINNASTKLKQEVQKITGYDDVEIEQELRRGVPSEEILKAQEENNIHLIVIASHGQTGILKNLIGSVASKITKRATCPVLLIRS